MKITGFRFQLPKVVVPKSNFYKSLEERDIKLMESHSTITWMTTFCPGFHISWIPPVSESPPKDQVQAGFLLTSVGIMHLTVTRLHLMESGAAFSVHANGMDMVLWWLINHHS